MNNLEVLQLRADCCSYSRSLLVFLSCMLTWLSAQVWSYGRAPEPGDTKLGPGEPDGHGGTHARLKAWSEEAQPLEGRLRPLRRSVFFGIVMPHIAGAYLASPFCRTYAIDALH